MNLKEEICFFKSIKEKETNISRRFTRSGYLLRSSLESGSKTKIIGWFKPLAPPKTKRLTSSHKGFKYHANHKYLKASPPEGINPADCKLLIKLTTKEGEIEQVFFVDNGTSSLNLW